MKIRPIEPALPIPLCVKDIETRFPIAEINDPSDHRIDEVVCLNGTYGPLRCFAREDFAALMSRGAALVGHTNAESLISEALIILSAGVGGSSPLERCLPNWAGYEYGSAVAAPYRGRGLQRELIGARLVIARDAGKSAVAASVRLTNLASIKSTLDTHVLIADAPGYFGTSPECDRVLLVSDFAVGNPLRRTGREIARLVPPAAVPDMVAKEEPVVSIPIRQSETASGVVKAAASLLLRSGYIGVAAHELSAGVEPGLNVLTFVRIGALPDAAAAVLYDRQRALQEIADSSRSA